MVGMTPILRLENCGCVIPERILLTNFKLFLFYTFTISVCVYSAYVNYRIARIEQNIEERNQIAVETYDRIIPSRMQSIEHRKSNAFDSIKKNEYFSDALSKSLEKYAADKTGMADFALQSLGGKIISIRHTKNYHAPTRSNWLKKIGGFFSNPLQPANAIIQPNVSPGNCWAFEGNQGIAVLRIAMKIFVKGISIEHIPKSISPDKQISSAPRHFSLHGLDNRDDEEGFTFGSFEYDENGKPVQHFDVLFDSKKMFNVIGVNFTSNWGNTKYTCVYRVRIHGDSNGYE